MEEVLGTAEYTSVCPPLQKGFGGGCLVGGKLGAPQEPKIDHSKQWGQLLEVG